MKCGALIILVFTSKREFVILDAHNMKVVFSNESSGRFVDGTISAYKCQNKDK